MQYPASQLDPTSIIPGHLIHTIIRPALLLILLLFSSFSALAYECTVDDICYNLNNDDKTASVTYFIYKNNNYYGVYDGYDGYISAYSGNIVIPKTITFSGTTYSVTSIGEHAFSRCYDRVTSVTIPNSITSIDQYAFSRCYGLTSLVVDKNNGTYDSRNNCNAIIETSTNNLIVGCKNTTIPNSVTSIGSWAFYGCSSLTSLTIPSSVTSIGSWAFRDCSGLTSLVVDKNNSTYDSRNNCNAIIETSTNNLIVGCKNTTIPNSVTSIGSDAFAGCSGLTSVTIGEKVTKISSSAFSGCSGLTSLTFNAEKCTEMGSYNYPVFRDCTNLKSLTIGNKVTTIPDYAFFRCSGLTSVTIGNSVTSIGEYAFRGCSGLTSMTIPNSVTTIGEAAFYGCSGLTSVTIGNSVNSIGEYAFYNCYRLTSVTIPNSVTSIGNAAFCGCSGLTSVTVDKNNGKYDSRDNCNAIIDTSTNTLIVGCKNTIIPNSVTSIGDGAFYGCSGLTSVTVDKNNGKYDSRNNCNAIIDTSTNKLIVGCKNTTIPNSVTSIGYGAFNGCSGLTSVTIPNSVTSIGYGAFANCSGLTSVTIPNSVTSIGKCAFYYCSGLTSVTIGNSVTSIGDRAFAFCSGLTKLVSLAVEPPTCGIGAFIYVDKTSCQLLVPEESINKYKTADQWKEFLNILGYNGVDDVSVDSQNAVYEVYNLQGVRVGGGMREEEVTADVLPHGVYILVSPQSRKKLKI